MNLITVDDLRIRIEKTTTSDDVVLEQIIIGISEQIEMFIGRQIQTGSITETFDVEDGQTHWFLKAYPVSSISSVRHSSSWEWTTSTSLSSSTYTCRTNEGILYIQEGYVWTAYNGLEVKYSGGISADTEGLKATTTGRILFEAALKQAAYNFKIRKRTGMQQVNPGVGSVQFVRDQALLDSVKSMLYPIMRGP